MNPPNPLPVVWVKNPNNGEYFDLLRLNLGGPYFQEAKGVYIIWYASPSGARVIRVGQGNIGERLKVHLANPQIIQYSKYGSLKVSWVVISPLLFDRVEVFLYDYYRPVVGERAPVAVPLPVTPLL